MVSPSCNRDIRQDLTGVNVLKTTYTDNKFSIEGYTKLANVLPPAVKQLRIVEIVGFDVQADGGTHVNSTKEVGEIEVVSAENKGKNNRRIYFRFS